MKQTTPSTCLITCYNSYCYAFTQTGTIDAYTLIRGDPKYNDSHGISGVPIGAIIAKCGAADLPQVKSKKIFLNCCTSDHYFYFVFNPEVLFFTTDTVKGVNTTKVFIESVINGENDERIRSLTGEAESDGNNAIIDYRK